MVGPPTPPTFTTVVRDLKLTCATDGSGDGEHGDSFFGSSPQARRFDRTRSGVAGFYATTTYRLDLNEAAAAFGAGKRRYPVPAVLLARLAVDTRCGGRGVGRQLLVHALEGFAVASTHVGFEAVVVHAIDAEAVTFYARYGFTRFANHDLDLYMTTKTLRASFAENMT